MSSPSSSRKVMGVPRLLVSNAARRGAEIGHSSSSCSSSPACSASPLGASTIASSQLPSPVIATSVRDLTASVATSSPTTHEAPRQVIRLHLEAARTAEVVVSLEDSPPISPSAVAYGKVELDPRLTIVDHATLLCERASEDVLKLAGSVVFRRPPRELEHLEARLYIALPQATVDPLERCHVALTLGTLEVCSQLICATLAREETTGRVYVAPRQVGPQGSLYTLTYADLREALVGALTPAASSSSSSAPLQTESVWRASFHATLHVKKL
jgi:hypothetical protein